MKILTKIARYLIVIVGVFWIVMSFDCFGTITGGFWRELGCFAINSSPGIVSILITWFLRKHSLIYGTLILVLTIAFFIIAKMYVDTVEKFLTILTVFLPLLLCGIVFIIDWRLKVKPGNKDHMIDK